MHSHRCIQLGEGAGEERGRGKEKEGGWGEGWVVGRGATAPAGAEPARCRRRAGSREANPRDVFGQGPLCTRRRRDASPPQGDAPHGDSGS